MFDLHPYKQSGARLCDYLPWAALVASGIVLNKDGSFQRTLSFCGPDLDSSTPSELMGASVRLNNALRRFGSGWCIHVEARRSPAPGYPDSQFPDALSWLIDEERAQVFETAGARFESRYFMTLTRLPPAERQGKLESLLFEGVADAQKEGEGGLPKAIDYRQHLERYTHETEQFLALLETLTPEARWLNDEETLTFLHDCVSDRPHRVTVPSTPFHLDALLTDAPLVGGLAPMLGCNHLRIISVRSFVTETEPGLLDALNRLPISYRWVTRFLPLDREEARRELERVRKRWFSKRKGLATMLREALFREESALQDNDATNQTADADLALQELGADAVAAGYATLTIVVAEPDETQADDIVRQIQQVTDGMGFVTQVESINAVEAWLGGLPGQAYADVRRPILLTPSLAHLLPLSAVWAGPECNRHLDAPPLMLTATDGATPFRLDLHVGDVGHTMIVGPTGAGKSVLLATLAAQWLRYPEAQVYLFDKGRSARATILGLGGDFFDLGVEDALGLQPLEWIGEASERSGALDWLTSLVASANVTITPELRAELWRALEILAQRPPEDRTLTLLSALVQDASVRSALEPFTQTGPYGRLLDHDRSSLGYGRVQAFEMDDLMRRPAATGAVLAALFHVLERRFDGKPTLLVLDEAWLFLKDAFFAAQIQDWLKTLRKRNVAVVFASQELADVEASPIASTIIEACLTRIFLPNDRAREPRSRAFYEALGLNARQIDLIASATPKRDYYFVSRDGSRLFELGLGPATLAFVAASRPEDHTLIDRVLAEAGQEGFAAAWLDARGLREAADAVRRFNAGGDASSQQTASLAAEEEMDPMQRNWMRTLLAAALALCLAVSPPPARAQMAVIDPANLAQSIMQVSHMIEQVNNQVRQIEQATAMLRRNPLQLSPELSDSISEARALFQTAQGIAFEAEQLGEDLRQLYPETWEAFDLDDILGQSDRWMDESRASLERAMAAEARAAASIERTRGRIDQALQSSSSSEGQTSAIQAGNQLLGIQASQLAEIHALLIAQGRALETERMERLAREERAREIQHRAFPTRSTTTPNPARSAF